ncbi:MAG: methyltransferase domain-containing protein [Deltaproteobacteria bacterium]|jgi:ubiquinone/menaquinone biosynthesis C-methylase UbiE|nr:methyltransferase domain-containing protein [Deltaproteobacteria bacterium]
MGLSFSCCGITCCHKDRKALDARVSQNNIGAVYDKIAPIYDIWGKLTESRARNRAIELAEIKNGQNILEVAVGTGLAFYEIVKRNPNGTNLGIDLSPGMLGKAKKRLNKLSEVNYSLNVGTAFNLNVEDESVDTLVNNYMFDLIPFEDMNKILVEFKRVLKKNGKLILVNMTEGERFGSKLYDFIYNISPKTMGGCRGVKLTESLQQQGFKIKVREYYQQMLFPSEVILAFK